MVGRTTIVVPCYNEADRLDTFSLLRFANSRPEIGFLFVDDGSRDSTVDHLHLLHDAEPHRMHFLQLRENQGKAEAVRQGMLMALGIAAPNDEAIQEATIDSGRFVVDLPESVGFWDADMATPLDAIPEFQRTLHRLSPIQMVIGSRHRLLGRKIRRSTSRAILGAAFARVASHAIGVPIRDTQCGAKLFRVNNFTRQLFAERFMARWIFDVELFARASMLLGDSHRLTESIYELPLDHWQEVPGSKLRRSDFVRAASELARIWWRYRRRGARAYDPQFIVATGSTGRSAPRAAG